MIIQQRGLGWFLLFLFTTASFGIVSCNQDSSVPSTNTSALTPSGSSPTPTVYKQFLYVLNGVSNAISAYTIADNDGSLNLIGSYATETNPKDFAITPSGSLLFVANHDSGTISRYSIDKATGQLTSLGSSVQLFNSPQSIGVSSNGNFLFVSWPDAGGNPGRISSYSISSNGDLIAINQQLFNAFQIIPHPTANYIFVTLQGNGNGGTYLFPFDGTTGNLGSYVNGMGSTGSAFGTPLNSGGVSPAGTFVYTAGSTSNVVKTTTVTIANNGLDSVPPVMQTSPAGIAIHPTASYVYVCDSSESKIARFSYDTSTGILTSLGAPTASIDQPSVATYDYGGKHLYVGGVGGQVGVYSVDLASGGLTSGTMVNSANSATQIRSTRIAQ